MFGNTCKMAFEAIIFVFVMHPFDVGDRCVVDGIQVTHLDLTLLFSHVHQVPSKKEKENLEVLIYTVIVDPNVADGSRRDEYIDHCLFET